jgi:hypothetical protein
VRLGVIVEIINGIGRGQPVILRADQFVVRNDDGTPIAVGARFGFDGAIALSKVGDEDFQRTLAALGIHEFVRVDQLILPKPPPGAKLVAGPGMNPTEGG